MVSAHGFWGRWVRRPEVHTRLFIYRYPLHQIPVFSWYFFWQTWFTKVKPPVLVEGRHHTLKKEGIGCRGESCSSEIGSLQAQEKKAYHIPLSKCMLSSIG